MENTFNCKISNLFNVIITKQKVEKNTIAHNPRNAVSFVLLSSNLKRKYENKLFYGARVERVYKDSKSKTKVH